MAGMMMKMAYLVVACMVVLAPHAEATITCAQVANSLLPCLSYLRTGGQAPPGCCNGVRGLNQAANNPADRKTACTCLKNAYGSFPGIKPANAAGLPKMCNVNIPYKISPSTDCSKVH